MNVSSNQIHGPHQNQPVLPAEVLERLGDNVTMRLYPHMGHTVNRDEIRFVQDMMDALSE